MSGMPLNKPRDAQRFRNAYLGTLSLQQEVDLKNYNANALYKRTGVVPSQIMDYRSPQEIMADIERLRILVRSELKEIADDKNAEDIAMELTADQIQFVAQHMLMLKKAIKPKYRFGIPKDIFIPLIVKYMNDEMNDRIQQAGLSHKAEPVIDVDPNPFDDVDEDEDRKFRFALKRFIMTVKALKPVVKQSKDMKDALLEASKQLAEIYPNEKLLQDISETDDFELKTQLNALVSELKTELVSYEQLLFLKDEIENENDDTQLYQAMINDIAIVRPSEKAFQISGEIFSNMPRAIKRRQKQSEIAAIEHSIFGKPLLEEKPVENPVVILPQLLAKDAMLEMTKTKEGLKQLTPLISPYVDTRPKIFSFVSRKKGETRGEFLFKIIDNHFDEMVDTYDMQQASFEYDKQQAQASPKRPPPPEPSKQVYKPTLVKKVPPPPSDFPEGYVSGFGIKGKGIGVEEGDKYALLGKFNIHLHKLRDDVLALHNLDGKSNYRFKPRKVSVNVGNVVRKIVNRVAPSFEDLSKLSEEDKQILNELIKLTKINVDIPLPTEDKEDLNQFEIFKGEIQSGNDSAEMIKKFKLLIMKLSHSGRLPKAQAKDIIMDLIQLGY